MLVFPTPEPTIAIWLKSGTTHAAVIQGHHLRSFPELRIVEESLPHFYSKAKLYNEPFILVASYDDEPEVFQLIYPSDIVLFSVKSSLANETNEEIQQE